MGSSNWVMSLSLLSVLGYGSNLVATGAISPGQLTTFLMYAVNVGASFFSITSVYTALMRATGAGERVFQLTDVNEAERVHSGKLRLPSMQGSISFKDVDFCYPTRAEQKVFSNMTLDIPAGKVCVLLDRLSVLFSSVSTVDFGCSHRILRFPECHCSRGPSPLPPQGAGGAGSIRLRQEHPHRAAGPLL